MRSMKAFPPFVLAGALLCSSGLLAQSSNTVPRITTNVDESSLTTLKGNVPHLARAEFDQGEADAATQLTHMRLVLSRSAAQQSALDSYLAQLQDKSSPNYHKWLTPQQFGQLYGPADSDIAVLVGWLQSHGLTLETVSVGRTNIAFSGSVSQVEAAFHTSIHSYQTADAQFYSNTTDPQIPSALAGVVMGIAHLNTIRPRAHSVRGSVGRANQQTGRSEPNSISANGPSPMLTSGGYLYIVPSDAATIYDTPNALNANFSSGTSYTGTGVNIGIGGDATISAGIVGTYRSTFLGVSTLPILNYCTTSSSCSSTPGNGYNTSDADEAYIDTELSGGMAPGATIYYYASADFFTGIEAALDANVVSIFSLSFGECESDMSSDGSLSVIKNYWSQAAAEGIAVTVSTGDSGSTSCDGSTAKVSTVARLGLSVSGYASTPYNIAVGGTDFYGLESAISTYVNTSLGTAGAPTYYRTVLPNGPDKGYIPESIWNDSTLQDDQLLAENEPNGTGRNGSIVAGSGGVSIVYSLPSWQTGAGIPATVPSGVNANMRSLPDVSVMSGNGYDYATWLICDGEYPCTSISSGFDGSGGYDAYGGTSTAAPAFAGILAMVEQKTRSRLGQAAQELYTLYNGSHAASVFHDVVTGNNSVPCVSGTANCATNTAGYPFETGYNALTGYDLASGLGSVDATQLVTYWNSTTGSAASTITVNATPNPATIAQSVTVTISVSGSSGTPTGTVVLTSGTYNSGAQTLGVGTCLATSCVITVPADSLAVGTDTLAVTYSGDTTYATTTNSSTTVTITGLTASVTVVPSPTSINSNQILTVSGTVACTGTCTGSTTPTGTVTLTGGGYSSGAQTLSATGTYSFTIPVNTFGAAGSVTLTAKYSGNATYSAASNSVTVPVTYVALPTPIVTVTPASNSVDSGQTLNVTIQVAGSGVAPTGTVTLSSGSYNSGAQTLGTAGCTAGSCVTITIPANSLNAGADTLTATYSGDANYFGSAGTTSVTVTASAFALSATNIASLTPGATTGNTSTVTVSSTTDYSGTVTLTCALTTSPSGANSSYLPTCAATSGLSTVTMTSGTASGTGSVTVSTTAASAALAYPKLPGKSRGLFGAGSGALLALLLFFGIPARRRSWRSMLGILVLMAALGSLAACGGGSSGGSTTSNPGTTAGTYTFTVTGTGNPTVTPAPTTTFTVTVN
jgi:subtilase family serine protease